MLRRPAAAECREHAAKISGQRVEAVVAVVAPVGVAMSTRIVSQREIAGVTQPLARTSPCVTRLAAAVQHDDERPIGAAPGVAG